MPRCRIIRRYRGIEVKRLAALLLLATAGCGRDATEPAEPPVQEPADITSRMPDGGTGDVSPATIVRITFGWPVVLPFYPENTIWLEHDGVRVETTLACPDSQTVKLVPLDILEMGTDYTVHVGPGIIRPGGLIAATQWTFTTGGRPVPLVDASRLIAHVSALADDSMRGRKYGTEDEREAAEYIRTEFERYGLVPFPDSGWMQTVPGDGFPGTSQNVIGTIPGAGALANEWVVIGAHYDHLGVRDGLIYNGADDNASGTAGVLELARVLEQYAATGGFGGANRRSLMFIAFGAEEAMMVGSGWFSRHPFTPLTTITAVLNMDMIGRLRGDSLFMAGVETAPEWTAVLGRYGASFNYGAASYLSDHRPFEDRGRPVLAFTTGTHPQYHTPEDDTELINAQGMAAVSQVALSVMVNLALRPHGPGG
jgi:hypothetical protein